MNLNATQYHGVILYENQFAKILDIGWLSGECNTDCLHFLDFLCLGCHNFVHSCARPHQFNYMFSERKKILDAGGQYTDFTGQISQVAGLTVGQKHRLLTTADSNRPPQ